MADKELWLIILFAHMGDRDEGPQRTTKGNYVYLIFFILKNMLKDKPSEMDLFTI